MNTINPKEINRMLGQKVDELVSNLFGSSAKKSNSKFYEIGSLDGEAGQSLKIYRDGSGYYDFSTTENGDYLDLWCQVKGMSFADVIRDAKSFVGVYEPERKKTYSKPQKPKGTTAVKSDVTTYLNGRGITDETITRFKIAQGEIWTKETGAKPAIVFPFIRNGETLQIKRIGIERPNGKKLIGVEKDCEPSLFGWQAMPQDRVTSVVITEGEIDCMTVSQCGVPALSVPFGGGTGGKHNWIETEYPYLAQFDTIYLCLDADEAGREAAKEIAERLGVDRCKIASLPHKDANECLTQGMAGDEILQSIDSTAKYLDREEIKRPSDFEEETIELMYGDKSLRGFETPWNKVNEIFQLGYGELSVFNGVNGHGKSDLANQICLHSAFNKIPTMIASMELRPAILNERLIKQATGAVNPPKEYAREVLHNLDEKLWLVDIKESGKKRAELLLELLEYGFRRYGMRLFLIDSLMKCGIGEDDKDGQKWFVDELCNFKNRTKSHVILVTHSRKGESESKPTGKMDVKGSGTITDLADNVFIVWRNKEREDLIQKRDANNPDNLPTKDELDFIDRSCGTRLDLVKNRNGGKERKFGLYFRNNQFLEWESQPIKRLVNPPMQGVQNHG